MSVSEAEAALAKYAADRQAWQRAVDEQVRRETPLREAAMKAAAERAEARKIAAAASESDVKAVPAWVVNPAAQYDWKSDARSHGLGDPAIALLERDGLVIAGPNFPQSFSVYGDDSLAPFVTSDSMLNGFHVLFEATLRRYELRRAERLRTALENTCSCLEQQLQRQKVDPTIVSPYKRHLALVIGPALRLLGSEVSLGDPKLAADIDQTVRQIIAANGVSLPSWLGPATPGLVGIDFRRCKPLGFYSGDPILADYYRALRWLQMVPLRASRDVEAGTAALVANLESANRADGLENYVEDGAQIWGHESDPTVVSFARGWPDFLGTIARDRSAANAIGLARDRIRQLATAQHSAINDRIRA